MSSDNSFEKDEYLLKAEKKETQKELERLGSSKKLVILEMPEFLTNPKLEKERKDVFDKIRYLLKRRFSLIAIADILQTNDYARLDEIISRKDETYRAVEAYTSEDGDKPVRLFSGFKKVVGDDYSRTYTEQEDRVKAAINVLHEGTYFEAAKQEGEGISEYVEDIVANIIDNPEFNLACQIESEFILNQMENAIARLKQVRSRQELSDLIEELSTISRTISEREHAYHVMDKLLTGKGRKIIPDSVEEKKIPESEEGER